MPNKQEEKEPKKEVLDLIGGSSKKKRAPQPAPAPAPSRPAPVKKEALDLLSGNKKKASRAADAAPAPAAAPAAAEPAAPAPQEEPSADDKIINLKPPVSVSELAGMLKAKPFQIIKDLMGMGIFANPNTPLDADAVSSICDLHGYTFAREKREKGGGVKAQQEPVKEPEPVPVVEEPKATLITRTPIITVMGHVDHGKTSLLDYIRKTRVAKGEAGGITQHIGAYTVDYNGSTLTFLDTPGHAIFTEMRARGADVTDIVVLVVAANDGIMPQTREAIAHSKAAGKTIIVAINKCDLPAADPVKTKSGLMEEGLVPTDFGGDVECVEVSALTGAGIDDLLGLLVLQSEVLELQANPKANCRASIIEARVEPGTGSSATAIVESGTIRVGMPFICGPYAGKVRALVNDHGERVKKVGPGMPVEITGFSETPNVGDELVEMENERAAKKLGEERQEELRKQRLAQPRKARPRSSAGGKTCQKRAQHQKRRRKEQAVARVVHHAEQRIIALFQRGQLFCKAIPAVSQKPRQIQRAAHARRRAGAQEAQQPAHHQHSQQRGGQVPQVIKRAVQHSVPHKLPQHVFHREIPRIQRHGQVQHGAGCIQNARLFQKAAHAGRKRPGPQAGAHKLPQQKKSGCRRCCG